MSAAPPAASENFNKSSSNTGKLGAFACVALAAAFLGAAFIPGLQLAPAALAL